MSHGEDIGGGALPTDRPPTPDELSAVIEASIWREAAGYSPDELAAHGLPPDDPRLHDDADNPLIRLEREVNAGSEQQPTTEVSYPGFQFREAEAGQLEPVGGVVSAVNKTLGVIELDDPWGVADWWLGKNAWLDAKPVDLLADPAYHESILRAAEAVGADDSY